MFVDKDSYSTIYLVPNSIIYNPGDQNVLYEYGVISSEPQKMDYTLDIFVDDTLTQTKHFSLNNGEKLEERVITAFPSEIINPKKITLNLTTGLKSESIHFWLNRTNL